MAGPDEPRPGKTSSLIPVFVVIGAGLAGFAAVSLVMRPAAEAPPPPTEGLGFVADVILSLVVGGLLLAVAAAFYFIVLATGCFTADFGRPVFKKLKPRLFVANVVLMALLLFGLGLTFAGLFQIAFRLLGVGWSGLVVGMVVAALVVNVGMVRFSVWAPFEPKLANRRLLAAGVPAAELARATCVGISDPGVSGWKKAILEDDIGFLWLEPDRLVYRGDGDAFEVARGDLLAVERVVLAASATAYSGNRHIVLRFRTAAGGERRTCLHPEGLWTPGRVVGATNELAARLAAWCATPSASPA